MTGLPTQLVLRFPQQAFAPAELLPNAGQDEARAWLARPPQDWPLGRLALWGPPGSGKTHLAQAWAERVGGAMLASAPGEGWPGQPVAIDSIEDLPDEPALLYLLNAAVQARQPVLLVSRTAPGRLPVRLPDLASRLRATTAVQIGRADDAFLAMLLARLLAERQMHLPGPLQSWLLARLPRTPAALRDAVGRLDAAAAAGGRTITRPVAAAALGLCDTSMDGAVHGSPPTQDMG